MVRIKNLCLIVEERLLLKLLSFAGFSTVDQEQENVEENDFEMQQILAEVASVHAKRYYFEILELVLGQVSRCNTVCCSNSENIAQGCLNTVNCVV